MIGGRIGGLVGGIAVAGGFVGGGTVAGGFVETGGDVGSASSGFLGRSVAVGGMSVGEGDAVGVRDGVRLGEAVDVKTMVAEGADVSEAVG